MAEDDRPAEDRPKPPPTVAEEGAFRRAVLWTLPVAGLTVGGAAFGAITPAAAAVVCVGALAVNVAHFRRLALLSGGLAAHLRALADEGRVSQVPLIGAVGTTRDLMEATDRLERVIAERRLEVDRITASNQAVLAGLPDPLVMLAADRRVVRANPAATAVFGRQAEGRTLAELSRNPVLLEAAETVLADIAEARAGDRGLPSGRTVEVTMPVPVPRTFRARIEPLSEPAVDGTVAMLALYDVTALKRAEELRLDFVANASHELRTPLSSLIGFIETLRGPARDDTEARERFLGIMFEQANRMARLVDGLMSLSRIEQAEHSPPDTTVDLRAVVTGAAATLELKARARDMRIVVEDGTGTRIAAPTEGGPGAAAAHIPEVAADPDEMTQLFQNLIDNAIKYGRAGSTVRVRILGPGEPMPGGGSGNGDRGPRRRGIARPVRSDMVAVAVTDEGAGIPREHLPRLTERFYRVDKARSQEIGGVGLGLAIVKHILNRHRGRIDVESEVGRGSTFTVSIPAAEAAQPETPRTAAGG